MLLSAEHISINFGSRQLLSDVNFYLNEGDKTGIIGINGTGKSTFLKVLAGIDDEVHLISRAAIEPIQEVKVKHLGSQNPRLHSDEILIALAISAATDPLAAKAQRHLDKLRGCDAHFSVIISGEDIQLYQRLGINVSCEPRYETKKLYHK